MQNETKNSNGIDSSKINPDKMNDIFTIHPALPKKAYKHLATIIVKKTKKYPPAINEDLTESPTPTEKLFSLLRDYEEKINHLIEEFRDIADGKKTTLSEEDQTHLLIFSNNICESRHTHSSPDRFSITSIKTAKSLYRQWQYINIIDRLISMCIDSAQVLLYKGWVEKNPVMKILTGEKFTKVSKKILEEKFAEIYGNRCSLGLATLLEAQAIFKEIPACKKVYEEIKILSIFAKGEK